MEADGWTIFSAASRRHQSSAAAAASLHSRFDAYLGFDDVDAGGAGDDDDARVEFACPFCSEDFDIFGLCCHIDDDHPNEARNGVCPVCAARVGTDMVQHITMQHGNFFKMQRKRRFRRGSPGHSTLSLLKKELREGNLHSLLGGSTYSTPSLSAAPDPLLSSFIYNLPHVVDAAEEDAPAALHVEALDKKASEDKSVESVEPTLSEKDQKERTQRSEFVQQLLLSTIFKDAL